MAQDDRNETSEKEVSQSQVLDQNRRECVVDTGAPTTAKPQLTESRFEDAEDAALEDSEEEDDATRDDTAESASSSEDALPQPGASSSAVAPAQSTADADADDRSEIEKQPYDSAPHHAA